MPPLFSYNGLLLASSGALAASEACCCDTIPTCECPSDSCIDGLFFLLDGIREGTSYPSCSWAGPTFGGIYEDRVVCGNEFFSGFINLVASCQSGIWKIAVSVSCNTLLPGGQGATACVVDYSADIGCDQNNLPLPGNVDLILVSENIPDCFPVPPVVTIITP